MATFESVNEFLQLLNIEKSSLDDILWRLSLQELYRLNKTLNPLMELRAAESIASRNQSIALLIDSFEKVYSYKEGVFQETLKPVIFREFFLAMRFFESHKEKIKIIVSEIYWWENDFFEKIQEISKQVPLVIYSQSGSMSANEKIKNMLGKENVVEVFNEEKLKNRIKELLS